MVKKDSEIVKVVSVETDIVSKDDGYSVGST